MCTREKLAFEIHRYQPSMVEAPDVYQDPINGKAFLLPVWALKKWPKANLLGILTRVFRARCVVDKEYPQTCLEKSLYPFEERMDEPRWKLPQIYHPGFGNLHYEVVKPLHDWNVVARSSDVEPFLEWPHMQIAEKQSEQQQELPLESKSV